MGRLIGLRKAFLSSNLSITTLMDTTLKKYDPLRNRLRPMWLTRTISSILESEPTVSSISQGQSGLQSRLVPCFPTCTHILLLYKLFVYIN